MLCVSWSVFIAVTGTRIYDFTEQFPWTMRLEGKEEDVSYVPFNHYEYEGLEDERQKGGRGRGRRGEGENTFNIPQI